MWGLNKIFGTSANNNEGENMSQETSRENNSQVAFSATTEAPETVENTVENTAEAQPEQSAEQAQPTIAEGDTTVAAGENSTPSEQEVMNVHHLIVLDESGSMWGITPQTISGCNETIQTICQMQERSQGTQRHFVSIFVFHSTGYRYNSEGLRYIIKDVCIANVREITHRDYRPDGGTPLYDALGISLSDLKSTIEKEHSLAYVTVITDGMENTSREFSLEMVRSLIGSLKNHDVIFSFIGANIDSASYAKELDIDNYMQFEQTDKGTNEMWERERRAKFRSSAKFVNAVTNDEFYSAKMFSQQENTGNYYDFNVPSYRITPREVHTLAANEIFVFGSNREGSHGSGAAYQAVHNFGAVIGQAEGRQGQSYAIPAHDVGLKELFLYINTFCDYAEAHPELTFLVTKVGCGRGYLPPYQVAPMFHRATRMPNVKLPAEFWDYLTFANI